LEVSAVDLLPPLMRAFNRKTVRADLKK
jgi:hypothetical protein